MSYAVYPVGAGACAGGGDVACGMGGEVAAAEAAVSCVEQRRLRCCIWGRGSGRSGGWGGGRIEEPEDVLCDVALGGGSGRWCACGRGWCGATEDLCEEVLGGWYGGLAVRGRGTRDVVAKEVGLNA